MSFIRTFIFLLRYSFTGCTTKTAFKLYPLKQKVCIGYQVTQAFISHVNKNFLNLSNKGTSILYNPNSFYIIRYFDIWISLYCFAFYNLKKAEKQFANQDKKWTNQSCFSRFYYFLIIVLFMISILTKISILCTEIKLEVIFLYDSLCYLFTA